MLLYAIILYLYTVNKANQKKLIMKNLHSNAGNQETAKRIAAYYSTTELKTLCHNLFSVSADMSVGSIERMMAKISFLFYP